MDSAGPSFDKIPVNGDAQMGWDELNSFIAHILQLCLLLMTQQTFFSALELNKAITPPEGRQELEDNKYLSPNLSLSYQPQMEEGMSI